MSKDDSISSCWPIAAASQIRVKILKDGGSGSYCRLFYNQSSGAIELVTCNEDEVYEQQPIYDDCNTNIENEPFYKSYIATLKDNERTVIDAFHPSDVIGANLSLEYNMNNPNTLFGMKSYASAQYNIYTYPKSKKGIRSSCCHKQYVIDPKCCEDFGNAQQLIKSIQTLSKLYNAQRSTPLKCLVILNPYSGGGGESSKTGAKHVYNTIVKPMLEQAGVEHDALVTRHGGHANERMAERKNQKSNTTKEEEKVVNGSATSLDNINTDTELDDITSYDAIIAMGGDGILFEIFQGIHARSDEQHIMSTMKFGILACGTFNGLVKSILHWSNEANYNHVESMMHICKGETFTLDVAKYNVLSKDSTPSDSGAPIIKQSYTSFLSFAWGLIADCDFESECIRWVGHLRSDIWAVYRGVLFRRQYRAKFSYLPPENAPKNKNEDIVMPKLGQPLPEGWKTFDDDDFLVFWVCNTSHAAHNMFTCPVAKMNDGLFHVLIVR